MRPDDVLSYLNAKPFQPFRIVMNSGNHYDVRHPEMARVTRSLVVVFFADNPGVPAERFEMVSLLLIERLEHLEVPAQA